MSRCWGRWSRRARTRAAREAAHPHDLLANAKRRAESGRLDDAVARVYRAVEALAQARLREGYAIETGAAPFDRVPDQLRQALLAKAVDDRLKLGLQDAYALLRALGEPLGEAFAATGWTASSERKDFSPLEARNRSILAHGFDPVREETFAKLFDGTLALAGVEENELPSFPHLRERA